MARAATLLVASASLIATTALTAQSTTLRDHLDPARFRAGTDSFTVMLRGEAKGWQTLTAARDGEGWTVGDAITIPGMVSQSSRITLDARLEQQRLRQEGVMMGKPMKIALDFTGSRVTGTALTPTNPAGEQAIDVARIPGLLDDNAIAPLQAFVRWREGMTITFPVLVSGKGTVSDVALTVLGSERVTVPAGTFETWRVELAMDRSRVVTNVTKAAPYRVVRMSNGPMFEMLLVK